MAIFEHLEVLKKGVEVWNKWRLENPNVIPDFEGADLKSFELQKVNLFGSNLKRTNLTRANLREADLKRATLAEADLLAVDMSGADLTMANLTGADISEANFSNARLCYVDLTNARFHRTDLRGTDFYMAFFELTMLADLDLRLVKNLDTVLFSGPVPLSLNTFYRSKGDIPHKFLVKAGVPTNFIENIRALTRNVIEFYSCFISYTEPDNAISEKLFYDLQAKEVRVWRWRERARTGEFMDVEINKAIRLHDKLIVICSGNSLYAEPVLEEIREALRKEEEYKKAGTPRTVLFPIRIDDHVFEWEHDLAHAVTSRFIGDFRNWTDPKEYKKSFDKLVTDLNKQQDDAEIEA
ncbi:MAG: TIR domain-containing protein [Chloroflexi bacterium]|nr:MAG: TIR domain-containing protein [Chloroflexota bacterium]MBL1196927.1 TIR domain-containing protein [Chloroflexota bacterium]NOH14223.1 toll/interleukin-1 receptor domain-containing protein [Chloroflexota bacterium]